MDPFIGQIQPFGFNFPPRGWSLCDGQLLPISQNTALFSLLGTTFGGDGRTTFALPDLRGRSIVHVGSGAGLDHISWGERGGRYEVGLNQNNLPAHSHLLVNGTANVKVSTSTTGTSSNESGEGDNGLASGGNQQDIFVEDAGTQEYLANVDISGSTNSTGGSIPFNTRNPFLGIYVSIALQGIFPSRN